MVFRCAETGGIIDGPEDGIWDDGEWVSWDFINSQIYESELRGRFPNASPDTVMIFEQLVDVAADYKELSGRYLQIFGELGELFAEITFGIRRHKPGAQGSDGRIGNDHIEIKTISPDKKLKRVSVKRSGNFNKLVVVNIDENFNFEARIIDRKRLGKGNGKFAQISWSSLQKDSTR